MRAEKAKRRWERSPEAEGLAPNSWTRRLGAMDEVARLSATLDWWWLDFHQNGEEMTIRIEYDPLKMIKGFSDSSVGKQSTCNAGDPSSIPGLGRSTWEGIGYPFQCSWASLVAQLVKNPPAVEEIWDRSLSWEDPLEKGKATHSSILAWRVPWTV